MLSNTIKPVVMNNIDNLGIISLPGSNPSTGRKTSIPVQVLPYKRSKVMHFRNNYLLKNQFEIPEYNLYEISAAEDGDGIIRQAIKRKAALMFTEGWKLNGLNPDTIEYIEERLLQIGLSSGIPIEEVIEDTGTDLVRYHNAFWVLYRDDKNTSGKKRKVKTRSSEKDIYPIVAVFRVAPETMRLKTDKWGNPKKYMQIMPDGRSEEYVPENVIHFYINRRAGFNIAAPGLLPAIDEIRSLRQMEEYVELLVEQYLFPLFTLSVGTDEHPIQENPDGTTEVDVWTEKIKFMEVNGGLVFSHRIKMELHRMDKTIPVEEYLKHFKQRVYTACGVSPIDMSETNTSNRSTADSATKQLIADVKFYQKRFSQQIQFKFLDQLLLERYTPNVLRKQHVVKFQFNEIDIEAMIKLQNHHAMMYSMNYETEDEARAGGGLSIISNDSERDKMFLNTYEIPKLAAEEKYAVKAGTSSSSSSNQAKNKQQPTNQHKTLSGPSKRKSSLRSEDIYRLKGILGHFADSDPDLIKLQLGSWLITLDKSNYPLDFCFTIESILDDLINTAYQGLQDNSADPIDLTDILYNQITTLLSKETNAI